MVDESIIGPIFNAKIPVQSSAVSYFALEIHKSQDICISNDHLPLMTDKNLREIA